MSQYGAMSADGIPPSLRMPSPSKSSGQPASSPTTMTRAATGHDAAPRPFSSDELNIFRHGVGLPRPAPADAEATPPQRSRGWLPFLRSVYALDTSPPPGGLYGRVLVEELSCVVRYYPCAAFINASLFAQVLIAAALTALGASAGATGHRARAATAVTVLGAANTVIAGTLALLKGRGLPNRLRQDLDGLRRVRDFIEDRECDFERWGEGWREGDAKAAVRRAREMYGELQVTMESNRADSYMFHSKDGKRSLKLGPTF